MVSIHRPVHSKITPTCLLSLANSTARRVAFKALYAKVALSWNLVKSSLRLLFEENCQNGLLLEHGYVYTVDYRLIPNYVLRHIDKLPIC